MDKIAIFKAKKFPDNSWEYGVPMKSGHDDDKWYISNSVVYNDKVVMHPVLGNSICEFIGITDKRYKRIYENDILKDRKNKHYIIKKRKGHFIIKRFYYKIIKNKKEYPIVGKMISKISNEFKIINNLNDIPHEQCVRYYLR